MQSTGGQNQRDDWRLELDAAAALYAAVALEYGRNSPSFNVCSSRLWQVLALAKACGPVAHEFA